MTGDDVDKRAYELFRAANQMAAHNFEEWSAFIRAFSMYAEVPVMQLLLAKNATGDSLHNLQGRARMAHELAEMLMNCRENLQTLEGKAKAQRNLQARKGIV